MTNRVEKKSKFPVDTAVEPPPHLHRAEAQRKRRCGGRARYTALVSIRADQLSVGVREARRKQKRNKRGKIQKKELSARVEPHN